MRDGANAAAFITLPDDAVPHDAAAVAKHLDADAGKGRALLRAFAGRLAGLSDFTPAEIHRALESLAREHHLVNDKGGVNVGPIAQPVRIALAGTPVSPPLPECLAALGKDSSLTRLRRLAGQG
jgi:glutamyl-tRNA synthetase